MNHDQRLRDQLTKLLEGGLAFQPVGELFKDITAEEAGKTVPKLPYTIWQLLEHMRLTVNDILEFCQNPDYQYLTWPDDYWPQEKAPADQQALNKSIAEIQTGLQTMIKLVQDPDNDLYKPFPHGEGQTLLREALLVAEHTAYHTGEVIVLRRLLGTWK
ncbi:DinB family protein [Adhaeribacter sp. BT258]|uniref:DinB family protein n=1 Tax=Adhaeribacter terrigena TaxID=2793070 RepID=A0ABS1C2A8_9BACT|nr:DinB family protein [Adhaeribacter terrigena]MBK0402783.1 DinB family protein [Adhaeribacter terrigena]